MILGPDVSPAGLTSLSSIVQRALPVVMFLEKIRRRAGSIAVLIVSVIFLVSLPLIQIVPALLVALMSLAYLEEEGFCSVYRLWEPSCYWRLQQWQLGERSSAPLGSAGSSRALDAFTAASRAVPDCTP
jgi:hypothetical protein